jgi:hypothetical protein
MYIIIWQYFFSPRIIIMNRNTTNLRTNAKNEPKSKTVIFGTVIFACLLFIGMLIYIYYDDLVLIGSQQEGALVEGTINFESEIERNYERKESIATIMGTRESLFENEGYGLTFVWDMYVPNTMGNKGWGSNYNNMRPIMRWGESPHIYYNHRKNYLSVMAKYKDNPYYSQRPNINVEIPLQRWNKFIVVMDNRKVVIFINGKMVKTYTLGNVPIISSNYLDNITIGQKGNNIMGKIRNMSVKFRPLRTNEILLA